MFRVAGFNIPVCGCLIAAFVLITGCCIGESDCRSFSRQDTKRQDGYDDMDIVSSYADKLGRIFKRESLSDNFASDMQMTHNQGLAGAAVQKRNSRSPNGCPPGISERECNYELMAVWIRMLMKDNQ